MNNCIFGQSNITNLLSISHNGWSLTPIENQLHGMTINCVLETYNNTICTETHIQLHLHTIFYSKWSIIDVNWQTLVFFRITNRKKKIFVSIIYRRHMYFKILNKNTRVCTLSFQFYVFFGTILCWSSYKMKNILHVQYTVRNRVCCMNK